LYTQDIIALLRKFRTIHLGIAAYYVVTQAEQAKQEIKGTGGSSVVPYLKSIRDDTLNLKPSISSNPLIPAKL